MTKQKPERKEVRLDEVGQIMAENASAEVHCSAQLAHGGTCNQKCFKMLNEYNERHYWSCPSHGFEGWAEP